MCINCCAAALPRNTRRCTCGFGFRGSVWGLSSLHSNFLECLYPRVCSLHELIDILPWGRKKWIIHTQLTACLQRVCSVFATSCALNVPVTASVRPSRTLITAAPGSRHTPAAFLPHAASRTRLRSPLPAAPGLQETAGRRVAAFCHRVQGVGICLLIKVLNVLEPRLSSACSARSTTPLEKSMCVTSHLVVLHWVAFCICQRWTVCLLFA